MNLKLIPVLMIFFALGAQGQEKTHPNNPRVILSENQPEKWRLLSQEKKYVESASELIYLVLSDTTRNKHADFWHIGQMYAMANQYDKAKFYMTKAVVGDTTNDKQWMWYFYGTIAFLDRDRDSLEKYTKLLNDNHTQYYSANSKTLNRLLANFEKTYRDCF
jgi:tetratricopeptide (TPR) repeat protein